jgi:hypothetical protein
MSTLVGTAPVVRVGRAPWLAASAVAVVSGAVLVRPDVALGALPSFLPA